MAEYQNLCLKLCSFIICPRGYKLYWALKEGICQSNQFTANFIKIYQEIKKLYAFAISIISFIEAVICVCLWRHNCLIRHIYAKMKHLKFEK